MLCEICKENQATVHFKQVFNGEVKQVAMCVECARKSGFDAQSPFSVTDFLFGLEAKEPAAEPADDRACPACHMRPSDFKKTSRLGCPNCYESFAAELGPMLAEMQDGSRHRGKVPAGELQYADREALQRELDKAVLEQNFESAATLRDRIRALDGVKTAGNS